MQLNGIYMYKMDSDTFCEPLNLVKKKTQPDDDVVPDIEKIENNPEIKSEKGDSVLEKLFVKSNHDFPNHDSSEDESTKNVFPNNDDLHLAKVTECKGVDNDSSIALSHDYNRIQKKNSNANNLYAMMHNLAASEHKFLSNLYVNIPSIYSNLGSFPDMQQRLWQVMRWQEHALQFTSTIPAHNLSEVSAESKPPITSPYSLTPPNFEKLDYGKSRYSSKWTSSMDQKISTSSATEGSKQQDSGQQSNNQDKKKPHIKKPLNAFMLYMKEMRAKVVAECTLKESAAINQILGRRWHSLTREEQAKYYEKARQERQLHMQLYPGWSARDNYGYGAKKKKRKKERSSDPGGREEQAKYYELARRERQLHMQLYPDWSSRANSSRGKKRKRKQETNDGGNSMKKCRARYGLDQQSQWCKPCRRKKKCIRYMESGESVDGNQSEDNLGSCGSIGDAQTPPDDDAESLPHSLSSPGGLSGLSSLTSPSMILPSPSTSLASPSVSLASPCMSLQSPLTPHDSSAYDCKPLLGPPVHRNPVGTNPHDINNPLSVNQLTGKCIKSEPGSGSKDNSSNARPVISVT